MLTCTRVSILDGVNAHDEEGNPIRRSWRMPMDLAILKDLIVKEHIAFLVLDPVRT